MRHAEVEPATQRGDRGRALRTVDVPGALADYRHLTSRRAELTQFHGGASCSLALRFRPCTRSIVRAELACSAPLYRSARRGERDGWRRRLPLNDLLL